MIRNLQKYISMEDSELMVTESEDVAVKSAEDVIAEDQAKAKDQSQENDEILKETEENVENIKEQAEEPFNPHKIETDDPEDPDEDQSDFEQGEGELDAEETEGEQSDSDSEDVEGTVGDEGAETGEDNEDPESESADGESTSGTDTADEELEDETSSDGESDSDESLEDETTTEDDDSETDEGTDDDSDSGDSDADSEAETDLEDTDGESDSDEDSDIENDESDDEDSDTEEDSGEEDSNDDSSEDTDSDDDVGDTDINEESEENDSEESENEDDPNDNDESDGEDSEEDDETEEEELDDDEIEVEDVDLSTTEEEAEEAEEEADNAEADAEEIEEELIDDSKTLEDIEKEEASVEEFIQLLEVAISREHFEPVFMASVDNKLSKLRSAFGVHSPKVPSLEDYDSEFMSTYYYSQSLESFKEFKKKLANIKNSIKLSIVEKTRQWGSKKVEPRVTAINKRVDNTLAKVTAKGNDYRISLRFKGLDTGGKDVLPVLTTDLKGVNRIVNQLLKEQVNLQNEAGKLLLSVTKVNIDAIPAQIKKVKQLKVIDFKEFKDYELTQNFNILKKDISKSTDRLIDQAASHLMQSAIKIDTGKRIRSHDLAVTVYTKEDVVKILTLCKAYIALATKVKETYEDKILEIATKISKEYLAALDKQFLENAESTDDPESLEKLYMPHGIMSGIKELNEHSLQVYRFVISHCLFNAEVLAKKISKKIA